MSFNKTESEKIFNRHLEKAAKKIDTLIATAIYEATGCVQKKELPKLSEKKIVFRKYASLEPNAN